MPEHGKEQMLDGHILVSHLLCFIFRVIQGVVQILPDIRLSPLNLDSFIYSRFDFIPEKIGINAHLLDHLKNQAVLLIQQHIEQMLLFNFLIAEVHRCFLQRIHGFQ